MPTLHETTRKRICRLGFFLLCLAPTVVTSGWIGSHYLPGSHERLEASLAERLRVTPKLAAQQNPKPGLTRFSFATLADFAAANQVELRKLGDLHVVQIKEASLKLESLGELLKVAAREWESPTAEPLLLRIEVLNIDSKRGDETKNELALHNVRLQVDRVGEFERLRLAAQLDPNEANAISALVQQEADGTWRAKLDASATALPVRLLSYCAPVLKGLEGKFRGKIRWDSRGEQIVGFAQGTITGNKLSDYLPGRFPQDATGEALVELEELAFVGDRIQRLNGALQVESGELSARLFAEIEKKLWCRPQAENLATPGIQPQQSIPFDRLAVRMVFNEKGFSLWGDLPEDAGRVDARLMVRDGKALLLQPAWVDFSAGYWVQFAVGETPTAMPVSREAIELARRLPAPAKEKTAK